MQSKTSYFNRTVFFKTVFRFWPVWALYFAVWFLFVPLMLNAGLAWGSKLTAQSDILNAAVTGGPVVCGIFAVLSVMAVFSFLYNTRSCGGFASLPLSRTCVFLSTALAGLLPLLAVNVLTALTALGVQAMYRSVDLMLLGQWLGAVSLQMIFFYGFAVLCAQLTGNIIVLPAVYAVLNFTVVAVELIARYVFGCFVYGAGYTVTNQTKLEFLSPMVKMIADANVDDVRTFSAEKGYEILTGYVVKGWGIWLAYAAVGIVLAAAALALYRRRRMESAGEVVAIEVLKPVFKYCMTFGCALVLGYGLYSTAGLEGLSGVAGMLGVLVFMLFGAFVGYFAAEMLIRKSFKVWRGGWKGLILSAVIIAALMFATEFDLFGYEKYVPDARDVESVNLMGYEYTLLEEPENIAAVTELHRSIIENKDWHEAVSEKKEAAVAETVPTIYDKWLGEYFRAPGAENTARVSISYNLKNGRTVDRDYVLRYISGDKALQTDILAAQDIFNSTEAIEKRKETTFEFTADNIIYSDVYVRLPLSLMPEKQLTEPRTEICRNSTGESLNYAQLESAREASDFDESDYAVSCVWQLTPEEAEELYRDCILPDISDGTAGRVWVVTEEDYYNEVSTATINIDATEKLTPGSSDYAHDSFYTTVTLSSKRVCTWLTEHGIPVVSYAEAAAELNK